MAQTNSRIQGKFYPLQHEEWLRACRELKPAEKDVLYYIRTIDPYSDGVDLSVSGIALQLSTPDRQVHRSTVSRALKVLDEKGFIDLEMLMVRVKVLPKGVHCCGETTVLPTDNKRDPETTDAIATQQARSLRNRRSSKALSDKDSSTPKTNKTYSDFIQTLSEVERESFEKFVKQEWKRLTAKSGESGEEIVSLERFLARKEDIKNWHERFLKSSAGREAKKRAITSSHDWRNDPCFNEWIWEAFNRGYEWVHENEAEREQRKAFYDWAFATNAFEGVCL